MGIAEASSDAAKLKGAHGPERDLLSRPSTPLRKRQAPGGMQASGGKEKLPEAIRSLVPLTLRFRRKRHGPRSPGGDQARLDKPAGPHEETVAKIG